MAVCAAGLGDAVGIGEEEGGAGGEADVFPRDPHPVPLPTRGRETWALVPDPVAWSRALRCGRWPQRWRLPPPCGEGCGVGVSSRKPPAVSRARAQRLRAGLFRRRSGAGAFRGRCRCRRGRARSGGRRDARQGAGLEASATMCARRTGSASLRMRFAGIRSACPARSSAPRLPSRARASASAAAGGGSRKASVAGSATPKAAASRSRPDRSASRISGGEKAGRATRSARRARGGSRCPGSVRPARPARWSAEAREARTVSSRVSPVAGSNFGTRARPQSMTMRTPSMVMEVSAMEVASTILRRPGAGGRIAASCALADERAVKRHDIAHRPAMRPSSRSAVRSISRWPGRKARTLPVFIGERVRGSRRPSRPRSGLSRAGRDGGSRRESRGPRWSITGASPRSEATRAPSSVADMTSSLQIRAQRAVRRRAPARGRNRHRASARGTRRR